VLRTASGYRAPAVPAVTLPVLRGGSRPTVILVPGAPIAGQRSQGPGRNAAHCPGRPLHPQGHLKILSNRSAKPAPQKASSGTTLARGASADPEGLTARARPEARPEARAANLRNPAAIGRQASQTCGPFDTYRSRSKETWDQCRPRHDHGPFTSSVSKQCSDIRSR
jgi:hypothetical protein